MKNSLSKLASVDFDAPAKPEEPSPVGDLFPPVIASPSRITHVEADVPLALAPNQNRIAGLKISVVAAEPGRYNESNKEEILSDPAVKTIPVANIPDEGTTVTVGYPGGDARRLTIFAVVHVEVEDSAV